MDDMDEYLSAPAGASNKAGSPNMAPLSPSSPVGSERSERSTLDRIGEDLHNMASTKQDLQKLTSMIHELINSEMAHLRAEVTTQDGRLQTLEASTAELTSRSTATDIVVASTTTCQNQPNGLHTPHGTIPDPRSSPSGSNTGLMDDMDEYLSAPAGASNKAGSPNMAPLSPSSPVGSERSERSTLDRIGEDLHNMASTKQDLQKLTSMIHELINSEMAHLRAEVTTQDGRLQTLEASTAELTSRSTATDIVVAR
ncbi:Hypothetical predicted protein [Pelobates cultripes]|uniref:Uncharacterized protein n=1 Tax=Pelobates cultripes TaxID=61616 RepID=A0AAD1VM71_PELCU|nr:Hypothetical predicted protein [Pelobates cultripes]